MTNKKHLVLSAVNLTEGGPLTVLRDCLAVARKYLMPEWEITVLVHSATLIDAPDVNVIAYPNVKKRWINRMFFEWWQLRKISKNLQADLWFSLHDITPVAFAKRHVVYCHNPSPYYKIQFSDLVYSPRLVMMRFFYGILYGVNIKKNDYVIVQQQWLRESFQSKYNIDNVVVAHPSVDAVAKGSVRSVSEDGLTRFIYPALPRPFKNHEVLFSAASLLWNMGIRNFEINFTVSSTENKYIHDLCLKYGSLPCLKFLNRLPREEIQAWYDCKANALLFPSRLETWGLPISEAKAAGLPMICADISYAYETVGTYDQVRFCSPDSPEEWAEQMLAIIEQRWQPLSVNQPEPEMPFSNNWQSLLEMLTKDL